MKRRIFLTKAATAVGAVFSSTLLGNAQAQDHSSHGMPAATMGHSQHDMGAMMRKDFILGNRTLDEQALSIINNADNQLMDRAQLAKNAALPNLPLLPNESKEAGVFRATLEAKPVTVEFVPGTKTDFWAYNNSIPGQTIEVYEGDRVEITLKNSLPQATTLHWHGILVPPSEDGNPQDAVQPGTSRTYRFTIPEGTAGTYWYHPHGHNTVAEQAYRGLAGIFIVKAKNDPFAAFAQQNWLISDLKLKHDGRIADNSMNDWMNGREGQFALMNGSLEPLINLKETTRVRLWNAASSRYINLALEGAELYIIATDGGFIEQPKRIKTLLLSPGERAELIIVPKTSGTQELKALAYDRGKMGMVPKEQDLILAQVTMQAQTTPKLPEKIRTLPNFGQPSAHKHIEYTEIMDDQQMVFLVNGKVHDMERVDLTAKINAPEEWTIFNNSHMDHNFHIHGTQFLVLEHQRNGEIMEPSIRGLKDTINLKPYETVKLIMQQTHKGLRMYHCHILEHETLGMMGQLHIL